jgi:hypothetical protein
MAATRARIATNFNNVQVIAVEGVADPAVTDTYRSPPR